MFTFALFITRDFSHLSIFFDCTIQHFIVQFVPLAKCRIFFIFCSPLHRNLFVFGFCIIRLAEHNLASTPCTRVARHGIAVFRKQLNSDHIQNSLKTPVLVYDEDRICFFSSTHHCRSLCTIFLSVNIFFLSHCTKCVLFFRSQSYAIQRIFTPSQR